MRFQMSRVPNPCAHKKLDATTRPQTVATARKFNEFVQKVGTLSILVRGKIKGLSTLYPIALAAGLLCVTTCTLAQDSASVTVPFAFLANHQPVPAGSYKIQLLSDRFMSFADSRTGRIQTIVMVRPEPNSRIETRGRLVFYGNGGQYFLTEVWIAETSVHSELAAPARFGTLGKNSPPAGTKAQIALN